MGREAMDMQVNCHVSQATETQFLQNYLIILGGYYVIGSANV